MKKSFPGHFAPTKKELDHLWETCLFTLDTNILLNLYRYSDTTRSQFIEVLKAVKDRLWLPHRAAEEYFENRLAVISQQEKAYEDAISTIEALQASLSNARQHPFLSDRLMHKLTPVLKEVVAELSSTKEMHARQTSSDEIQNAIGDVFNGRVGLPCSDAEVEAICKEGETRYARKLPPGYKDDVKDDGGPPTASNYRKYGDLIIWRQIMARAAEVKKGVIFVNDDKKEDWWLISRGKTLGPRPELIHEFIRNTGQGFYMYQADQFLKYAAQLIQQEIAPESMDEIRELRKRDSNRQAELLARDREEMRFREEELMLRARAREALARLESLRSRTAYLRDKVGHLQHDQAVCQDELHRLGGEDRDSFERSAELRARAASAQKEMERTLDELKALDREYAVTQEMLGELQAISEQRFGRGRGGSNPNV